MKAHHWMLAALCGLALLLRLTLMPMLNNPGIHDSQHYYNLGARLVAGHGFSIDYVWHFNTLHDSIEHPTDHWMPLTGVLTAAGMLLFGVTPHGAMLPFVLLGSLLPLLSYMATRQLGLSPRYGLLAAAMLVAVPEIIWQSTRPLTTVPQMWLVGGALLALMHALKTGRLWVYLLSGACLGLAYLNRNDAILLIPAIVLTLIGVALWGKGAYRLRWGGLLLTGIVAVAVVTPWLVRNVQELGQIGASATTRMMLMSTYNELYLYVEPGEPDPISLETWLQRQTIQDVIAKRLFEFAAALKQMTIFIAPGLPLLVAGGGVLALVRRERGIWPGVLPVISLLLVTVVVYPFLLPYQNQGGSFRTAYLSLVPLLVPLAAYGLKVAIPAARLQAGLVALLVIYSAALAWDNIRLDVAIADRFHAVMQDVTATAQALPDITGDGEVRLLSQDPFVLRYYGIRSAAVPYGTPDDAIKAARRYEIDYILMPTSWNTVDVFYGASADLNDAPVDPRFTFAAQVPRGPGQLPYELYAIEPSADASAAR